MGPDEFLDWMETEDPGQGCLELSALEGEVRIEGFMVPPPRRQGLGTRILAELCRLADIEGITLSVVPEPVHLLVAAPISREALEAFYARHGFSRGADGIWRRLPKQPA